jgi:hypothetical protein
MRKIKYICQYNDIQPHKYGRTTSSRNVMYIKYDFLHWLYSPLGPWPLIFQYHGHFTNGRTPWTSDQLAARPLTKHRITKTQTKHIHLTNIYALCGIRTHNHGFRASENSTCFRPIGYRDRQIWRMPQSMDGRRNCGKPCRTATSESFALFMLASGNYS